MKMFPLCAILLLATPMALSQGKVTLNGVVVDEITNTPLPFASVGIKNRPLSTVTNQQGQFTFHIPMKYVQDTLTISMLGYKPVERPVNTFDSIGHITFHLFQDKHVLDGIIVTDTLTGHEIMMLALEKMPVNYPDFPVSMSAFYRETQEVNGDYVSLLEAALTIYDENNVKKRRSLLRTKIRVDQLRRSFGYKHEFNEWWENNNLMMHALNLNPIPYGQKALSKGKYTREKNTEQNGQAVYVITTDNLGYWRVRFYVQAGTYAILRIVEHYNPETDGEKKWEVENKAIPVIAYPQEREAVIDFRKFEGRYHLSYLKFDALLTYVADDKRKVDFRVKQDIIINDINVDDPIKIQRNEATRINRTLKSDQYDYDPAAWDDYNILTETPLERKLIKDLEKKVSLQKQFQSHNQ